MVVVVDSQVAGISGDMLLCALVDLGADKSKIIDGVKTAENFLDDSTIKTIEFIKTKKHGIEATSLFLDLIESKKERKATDIEECLQQSIEKLNLSVKAKNFVLKSIRTLIKAESKIHGEKPDSVHFHEASSIDTVIDILGTAIALENLNYFDQKIISTPVAVGGGKISFSHGITSNPASAILEIFKNSNIQIVGGNVNDELTTPTGAAMLVNLADSCEQFYPFMSINRIGYGAGTKDFENFSNVLKIVEGKQDSNFEYEFVKILETNVDDVSGELLGNLANKIMNKGAKDITITPTLTKKGRPGYMISIICDNDSYQKILDELFCETQTLGIRLRTSKRIVVNRQYKKSIVAINGHNYEIRYKISPYGFKVEADDVNDVAMKINKSFKKTEELIRTKLNQILEK